MIKVIRGTTPTHSFKLPFDCSNISAAMVIYAQDNVEIFHKNKNDCEIDKDVVLVHLTQEETLKFDCNKNVQIQLKVKMANDEVLVSPVYVNSVGRCLNDEVL